MAINISFWIINGLTIILLVSPLFLIMSYLLVIFIIFLIPLKLFFLYCYFSLPRSQSSINQFENISIAHRGGRPLVLTDEKDDFPENTLAAYRWASNTNGVHGIELDVWLSRDHIPMVNHDGYLEHTFAECSQFISSLTCDELKKLKYLKKNKRDIYDHIGCETIPTLEEVILFLEPTKLKLMIEIKEIHKKREMAKIIDELFRKYPFLYERAYCAAFHPYNLYCIRRLNSRITTAYLFVPNITKFIVYMANQTRRPLSKYFIENVILRWIIDSTFMWFGTPNGLKFLGADLACIEHHYISQDLLDKYKKEQIIVCAWNVNESEQCQCESFFFFFTVEEARLLDKRPLPKQPPLPDDYDIKFIDNILNAYEESKDDFRVCFAGWFEGIENASYDLIYEENILQYLTMATYRVKYWHEMTNKQQYHIKKLYNRFFEKYPEQRSKIKPGYNNNIQMRHPYRDLIKYTHYPLLKYLSFGFTRSVAVILLMLMGFRYQIIDNVPFYVRKYSKKTSSSPILLLHGLSLGPSTYIPFIYHLIPLERTIILLDVPHASMRLQTEILSMSNMLASIEQLLLSLDEKKVAIISHSYGTLVHSCIVKQLSHLVSDQSNIFIDPVCFLSLDSRYVDNMLYRQPSSPNQLLLHAACAEDLYSIYHLQRHLCWYESILWPEDIKQSHGRIHVFFSEFDEILPTSFINDYLKKSNIDTTVLSDFKHGQIIIAPKYQKNILKKLLELETKSSIGDNESISI
ncbi:unnamed protein product [Adineta steineri]|uniref:GP-PDE domain-containing protein n=2 Tax=Adineta steineri TaxID=433720 RepID=A0A813MCZ7_9BILA|nr:unnamed protein product [Adineta steineri]CAF3733280.1 unnamed protein product [Adineta steineri]